MYLDFHINLMFYSCLFQCDRNTDILLDTEEMGSGVYVADGDDPDHSNARNTALYELYVLRVSVHRQHNVLIFTGISP